MSIRKEADAATPGARRQGMTASRDPQPLARHEAVLAEIRAAADAAYDANPGRPLSAQAARHMARLLPPVTDREAAA